MKNKVKKLGLVTASGLGIIFLGSCTSTPPNNAIFNKRGGYVPPPREAGVPSYDNTTTTTTPNTVVSNDGGVILNTPSNNNAGTIIEDGTAITQVPVTTPQTPVTTPAPVTKTTYTVQKGDSLWKIAANHGVNVNDLAKENNLTQTSTLKVGQTLNIPAAGSASSSGYAVPKSVPKTSPVVSSNKPGSFSSGGSQKYKVQPGDSLSTIASKFKTTTSALKQTNGLKSDVIRVNQELTIPNTNKPTTASTSSSNKNSSITETSGDGTYTVKKGDSLSLIAKKHGTTSAQIRTANNLKNDNIFVGQKLNISGSKTVEKVKDTPKIDEAKPDVEAIINPDSEKLSGEVVEKIDSGNNPDTTTPGTEVKNSTTPAPKLNVMEVMITENDTLDKLATDFNTTVELIKQANPTIKTNEDLVPGFTINIPTK